MFNISQYRIHICIQVEFVKVHCLFRGKHPVAANAIVWTSRCLKVDTELMGCHSLQSFSSWLNKKRHYKGKLKGKTPKNIYKRVRDHEIQLQLVLHNIKHDDSTLVPVVTGLIAQKYLHVLNTNPSFFPAATTFLPATTCPCQTRSLETFTPTSFKESLILNA